MLFVVNTTTRSAERVDPETFVDLKMTERYDIQEWVIATPGLLGEDLLVVTSEFDQFDRTAERLDVLMLDRRGKLVVVELKRSAVGTAADLQALRYAAYCSTLSLDDVAEMYAAFHGKRQNREIGREEALGAIRDFVSAPEFDELDDKPRIILAAEEFPPEMTATMLWLRSFDLDISAVRLRPYRIGDRLVGESSVLIPLPEAKDYLIRRERKEAERTSRTRDRQERYRAFFQELIDRLREDHAFTNARVAQPNNWYAFASGIRGITYSASFSRDAFRVEVYIDVGSREENKRIFDALRAQAEEIQPLIDVPISWERLDDRRASRVAIYREATINDPDESLAQTREWAIRQLLRFREVFGPRLERVA